MVIGGNDIRYAILRNSEADMTHTDSYDGQKSLTDSDVEDSSEDSSPDKILIS